MQQRTHQMHFPQQAARIRPDPIGLDKATMSLLTYLDTNKFDIARALMLIRTRPTHCNAREFVHKVAEYCISRVFDGKMDGIDVGVYLGMGMDLSGKTYAQGIKGMDVSMRINGFFVNLFTARPSVAGRDHLVAMILHHLIHAYFLVVCGRPTSRREGF